MAQIILAVALLLVELGLNAHFGVGPPIGRTAPAGLVGVVSVVLSALVIAAWWRGSRAPRSANVAQPKGNARRWIFRYLAWALAINLPIALTGQVWRSFDF